MELEQNDSYTWATESISYRGLKLTNSTSSLFRENYTPFLTNLSKELEKLSKSALSWSGRLASFKMLKLPLPVQMTDDPDPLGLFSPFYRTYWDAMYGKIKKLDVPVPST